MTVVNTQALSGPFFPNGVTVRFPFDFHAASAEEVAVTIDDIVVDVSKFATVVNDDGTGSVTFFVPPVGIRMFIFSDPSFGQGTNFEDQGAFYQSSVNEPIDRSAIRDIVLKDKMDRALLAPIGGQGYVFKGVDRGVLGIFDGAMSLQPLTNFLSEGTDLIDDGQWGDFFTSDGAWG